MSLRFVAEWLDSTAWSTALHESLYMYPLIETTHVLSLMFFVGTIVVVDLRMLGLSVRSDSHFDHHAQNTALYVHWLRRDCLDGSPAVLCDSNTHLSQCVVSHQSHHDYSGRNQRLVLPQQDRTRQL